MTNIPSHWKLCKLGDVIRLRSGFAFKSSDYSEEGIPVIRISDIGDGKVSIENSVRIPKEKAKFEFKIQSGDLLIAMSGATTGKTGVYEGKEQVLQNQRIGNFKIIDEVVLDRKYRNYYVASLRKEIEKAAYGGAQPNISAKDIESFVFPLAPLSEQKLIVAEIEKQFSRLDEAVANLKHVKANLKRYKAAVLKAAVEGKLTEKWRKAHPDVEPASELLKRILTERREKWTGKGKYKEPVAVDTASLSSLPEGWCWATVEQMTARVGDVDHRMPKPATTDICYVSTRDFTDNDGIDFTGAKRISREDFNALGRKVRPECGDILLSRYGTVGAVRVVKTLREFQASYSIAIIKTLKTIQLTNYLAIALRSETIQNQIKRDVRATAQPDLGLAHIKMFVVPVPPLAEQERIVAGVEQRFSVVEQLQAAEEANIQRANRLRQSVLQRAFDGKLVCATAKS